MPRITPKTPASEVQNRMNAARGGYYFEGQNSLWRNLLQARNDFVMNQLSMIGLTAKELKQMNEVQRYRRIAQFERAFFDTFFEWSRDDSWMQDAVGDTDNWIKISGMATWHIKFALASLEIKQPRSSASAEDPPPPPPPDENSSRSFDAVKDAAEKNANV